MISSCIAIDFCWKILVDKSCGWKERPNWEMKYVKERRRQAEIGVANEQTRMNGAQHL